MGMQGLGDDVTDIATAALNDATTAYVTTQTPTCPPGYTWNVAAAGCSYTSTTTTAGSPGFIIVLLIGAFLLSGGKF
jgi:hypothetical protein